MKLTQALSLIALATAAVAASAQTTTTSDAARALAAQATAQHEQAVLFRKPLAEPTSIGDYRAEAGNQTRDAQYLASGKHVLAYAAGERTSAVAVNSQDTARAEAHRALLEAEVAQRVDWLRSSPQARHDLEQGLNQAVQVSTL